MSVYKSLASSALRTSQRIASVTPQPNKHCFRVCWEDGHQAQFPYVWLRDSAKSRPIEHIDDLPLNIAPDGYRVDDNKLVVDWPPYSANVPYDGDWLRQHDFGTMAEPRVPARHDYATHAVLSQKACQHLAIEGAVLLTDQLVTEEIMEDMLDAVLVDSETDSGEKCVPLHTAGSQLSDIPKYAVIYAKQGTYHLCNAETVMSQMYEQNPDHYDMLLDVKTEWKSGEATAKHPVITVDERDQLLQAVFDYSKRSSVLPLSNGRVRRYYAALKAWHTLCQHNMTEVEIKQPTTIIVDNHRTLVGCPAQVTKRDVVVDYYS